MSSELAGYIRAAFSGGCEVSIAKVAASLGLQSSSQLEALDEVVQFLETMGLAMEPSIEVGDYWSPRVLRGSDAADTLVERSVRLMEEGESARVEFKASMVASMRDWAANSSLVEHPALVGEVLKTICAFLNTDGGDLLIGVSDDGTTSGGIELDMKIKGWNLDKWQLNLANLIASRFHGGTMVSSYIQISPISVSGDLVVHVSVAPRSARSFVQREGKSYEYFVRNGPRTESLDLVTFESHLRVLLSR